MPTDYGAVGVNSLGTKASFPHGPYPNYRGIMAGSDFFVLGGKDSGVGNTDAPSLKLAARGKFRLRWTVTAGTRSITVYVKQAANLSPRPTLVVKANPQIGVNADVSGTAGSSASWVAIGPISVSPTSAGALRVELWNNLDYPNGATPCYFDDISTT